jgi:hypothetical protein
MRTDDGHGGDGQEGIDNENWSPSFGVGKEISETDSKEETIYCQITFEV